MSQRQQDALETISKNRQFTIVPAAVWPPQMMGEYESALIGLNSPKVGGSPCFFNGHPGMQKPELYDYDRLLFQLPSLGGKFMFWDCGTANFMIKASALARLDFSEVFFSLDA